MELYWIKRGRVVVQLLLWFAASQSDSTDPRQTGLLKIAIYGEQTQ
jgi:hypothetical protein